MQKSIIKRGLVVGIIVLFIGIAIAPSVTSIEFSKTKTSNNIDLVEITLQLCKSDGVEDHKMFITQEQEDRLELLIESFKADLDNAETREETIEIYKDMVVSLDELGILPENTNCKEVQDLISGEIGYNIPEELKLKNIIFNQDDGENKNCQISGETDDTIITPFVCSIFLYSLLLRAILLDRYVEIQILIWFAISKAINFFPLNLNLGGLITFGLKEYECESSMYFYNAAKGWVNTIGSNGIKKWDGYIYGNITEIPTGPIIYYLLGAIGFTGLKINNFFLGSALWVKLRSKPL